MQSLPYRQAQLFDLIANGVRDGIPPVMSELARALGLAGESGVRALLAPLEAKELVTVQGGVRGRQRVIGLTIQGKIRAGLGLPVLGEIRAGQLSETVQEFEEWVDSTDLLLPHKPGDVLLKVRGDSMTGDGILDRDRVLLRPNIRVANGEIAAVQVLNDGPYSGTLKHVDMLDEGKTIQLRASNPAYESICVPADQVMIVGVYRGLVRAIPGA